jgi:hypothetical protein
MNGEPMNTCAGLLDMDIGIIAGIAYGISSEGWYLRHDPIMDRVTAKCEECSTLAPKTQHYDGDGAAVLDEVQQFCSECCTGLTE